MAEAADPGNWADMAGAALHYTDRGRGAPCLLLIHEMGGTLHSWDRLLPLLPPDWRVVRYDMRGHGLSEKARGTLRMPTMVGDALALIDHLGIEEEIVPIGCAVGGAVALGLAAHAPSRCAGVVALAPSTGLPPERREAGLARARSLEEEGIRPSLDASLLRSYPVVLREDPATFERLRAQRLGADPFGFAATFRMLAELDMAEDLKALRCPVAVIAGAYDQDRPPDHLQAVAATIPGATFRTIASGHFMAVQTPVLVCDEIVRFVQGRVLQGVG